MPPIALSSLPVHVRQVIPVRTGTTEIGLEVICAWPVSGQYGPGTRVLYYVLIAACLFARKEAWLTNACLAGALLFPAIAALHGIVLVAVHVDGAIDMDVYGVFQLCSIGILTAPLTARMSETYFKDPRRNIIFLWTGLVLAGLLSITVELFRIRSSPCTHDDEGNPIPGISQFPYENAKCDLRCSPDHGPFSPIRVGSTNEIYVIPSPNKLSFGTATLLAAACCVPAIVSLLYFWSLILQETWNSRIEGVVKSDRQDEPIEGTNGATVGQMLQINRLVRTVLSTVEAPVFAAAVLAILILGEENFFSRPVSYGTEPIASIGQWAPIVGAGFAIFGSLYLFLTADDAKTTPPACKCTCHNRSPANSPTLSPNDPCSTAMTVIPRPEIAHPRPSPPDITDIGYRRGINRALMRLGMAISIAAHDRLHDSEFTQGPAQNFPEIPAEEQRNETLPQIRDQYKPKRDSNGNPSLSRVGSRISMSPSRDGEWSSTTSQEMSSSSRSRSPFDVSSRISDGNRSSPELQSDPWPSATDPPLQPRKRQDTLEVPPHHGSIRRSPSVSSVSNYSFTVPGTHASPSIVVSADDEIALAFQSPEGDALESPLPLRYGRRFTS
ncbi:hypothetical protein BJX76DRAFT_364616 [Aspergillus varians]